MYSSNVSVVLNQRGHLILSKSEMNSHHTWVESFIKTMTMFTLLVRLVWLCRTVPLKLHPKPSEIRVDSRAMWCSLLRQHSVFQLVRLHRKLQGCGVFMRWCRYLTASSFSPLEKLSINKFNPWEKAAWNNTVFFMCTHRERGNYGKELKFYWIWFTPFPVIF